eukprot:gene2634-2935_t
MYLVSRKVLQELCDSGSLEDAISSGKLSTAAVATACARGSSAVAPGSSAWHSTLPDSLDGVQLLYVLLDVARGALAAGATHCSSFTCGTLSHCAPEVLLQGRQSAAADVYAFGMMVWEVLNNSRPFPDSRHEAEIILQVALEGRRPAWQGSPNSIGALLHRTQSTSGASSKQQWSIQVRHHWSSELDSDGSAGGTRWQLFVDSPGEEAGNDPAAELAEDLDQLRLQKPVGDPGPRLPGRSSGYWD